MENKIAEIRLTLYALISALEADLREIILNELVSVSTDLSFMKRARIPRSVNGDEWRFSINLNLKVAGFS